MAPHACSGDAMRLRHALPLAAAAVGLAAATADAQPAATRPADTAADTATDPLANYPFFERFADQPDAVQRWWDAAQRYRRAFPQSPYLPRLWFDLYIVAVGSDQQGLADAATAALLFDYGGSPFARHVARRFTTPADYRSFTLRHFRRHVDEDPAATAAGFARAVRLGLRQHHVALVTDPHYLLVATVAAAGVGDEELSRDCQTVLRRLPIEDPPLVEARGVVLSDVGGAELADRLAAVDHPAGSDVLRMLLPVLKPPARDDPRVLAAATRLYVGVTKPALAAGYAKRWREAEDGPEPAWYQAWCDYTRGRVDEAAGRWAATAEAHGDNPWGRHARRFADVAAAAPQALRAYIRHVEQAAEALRERGDAVEGWLRPTAAEAGGEPWQMYIALDAGGYAEAHLIRGGRTELALRVDGLSVDVYDIEKGRTERYDNTDGEVYPVFKPMFAPDGTGSYTVAAHIYVTTGDEPAFDGLERFAGGQALDSRRSITAHALYFMTRGLVPTLVDDNDDDAATVRWLRPTAGEPRADAVDFVFAADGRLTALRFPGWSITGLRHGALGEVDYAPPAWPDAPVVEPDTPVATAVVEIMGPLMRTVGLRAAAADTATQPADR